MEPTVVLNDEWTLENVQEWIETQKMPSIVISPGPGSPTFSRDTGHAKKGSKGQMVWRLGFCPDLFQCFPKVPILGVCLGHQILGSVYGGVTKRVNPVHGRLSGIAHNSHPLFCDISSHPEDFRVVRYHSLAVDENSLPEDLIPIAWTYGGSVSLNGKCSTCNEERVLMGLAHRKRPHYGVQFHPESIGSTFGEQLLINFRNLTLQAHEHPSPFFLPRNRPENELERCPTMHLKWEKLKGMHGIDSDALFDALFESMGFQDTFWLDRSCFVRFSRFCNFVQCSIDRMPIFVHGRSRKLFMEKVDIRFKRRRPNHASRFKRTSNDTIRLALGILRRFSRLAFHNGRF